MSVTRPYKVAMIQAETQVVVNPRDRDRLVGQNLDRILELLEWVFLRIDKVRLAITPEYSLMGQYRPRTVEQWLEIALPIPNQFTEKAGEHAKKYNCYIQLHFLERNDDWPGRYFNTTVVIAPSGEIVLTYRKHNGPNNLNTSYTGPADVYSEYVERYGKDALFPVVDTEIGRLGVMVCGDLQYPEMSRALALKGAEVILHPTAEPFRPESDAWDAMRRARAIENVSYFISVNSGAFLGSQRPRSGYAGRSQAYGPTGEVLAMIPEAGEAVSVCTVDIDRLRIQRAGATASGHTANTLATLRSDLFAEIYTEAGRYPNDAFADRLLSAPSECREIAAKIVDDLVAKEILVRPASK